MTEPIHSLRAIFAVIAIAYSFAKQMKTNKIFGSATAVMSWLLLMPYVVNGAAKVGGKDVPVSLAGMESALRMILLLLVVHLQAF